MTGDNVHGDTTDGHGGDIHTSDAAYVLGALSPAERAEYETHLATCRRCQTGVQQLAGLPGLLSLIARDTVTDTDPAVPETLLPALMAHAATGSRRRRWMVGGALGLAAACAILLTVVLVVRPGSSAPSQAIPDTPGASASASAGSTTPGRTVPMTAVTSGPMTVDLGLTDVQWGTAITVNCQYSQSFQASYAYHLVVYNKAGAQQQVGWWNGVAGKPNTVNVATSWHQQDISKIEVQTPTGQPILTATL